MKIYKVCFGHDNGCNGEGVRYFATKQEARTGKFEAWAQHTPEYGLPRPVVTEIELESNTRRAIVELLNKETSPLTE